MLRQRLRTDEGFTLVELLVVILIIGILAAAALPTLLGQRTKAQDAEAKTTVVAAAKAATTYGTDHATFTDVTTDDLEDIEISLGQARNLRVDSTARTFTVSVDSAAGSTFSIERTADGSIVRDCAPAGTGACRDEADDRGNRW